MTSPNYKFKQGNKYFLEFQEYYYSLSKKERLNFKRFNNIKYSETKYIVRNIDFLRWVRENIEKKYEEFFKVIIIKIPKDKKKFVVSFD